MSLCLLVFHYKAPAPFSEPSQQCNTIKLYHPQWTISLSFKRDLFSVLFSNNFSSALHSQLPVPQNLPLHVIATSTYTSKTTNPPTRKPLHQHKSSTQTVYHHR